MSSITTERKRTEATTVKKMEKTIVNVKRAKARRKVDTTVAAVAETTVKKASHRREKSEAKKRIEARTRKMEVRAKKKIEARKRRIEAIAADTKKMDLRRRRRKIKIGSPCICIVNRGIVSIV